MSPELPNTGAAINTASANTTRGFTGHEMDASTGLINMNARLYDPVLGRFISADTVVPGAGNMQAFNRYSYVDNNPLKYTDPTGHWKLKNFWKAAKPFVMIAAAFVFQQYYLIGTLAMSATAAGAITGGLMGALSGGGLKGALIGAIGGAYFGSLHGANFGEGLGGMLAKGAAHSLGGGMMAAMGGGDVGSGMIGGFINGAFAGTIDGFGGTGDAQGDIFVRVAASGVLGGATALVAGGKFMDGFQGAAFARLLNDESKNWKRQQTITNGGSVSIRTGRRLRVEVGTSTLGVDRVRFEADSRPVAEDGSLMPVAQNETRPYYAASPATGKLSTFELDAGFYNKNGWEWKVSIPMQSSNHDNSGGHFLTVSTYE